MLPITYAIRNLFRDPGRLFQTVSGSALVVLLVIAAIALNHGMEEVLQTSGSSANVILVGAGSEESVERSEVHLDAEAAAATGVPGLARPLGSTAASGEIVYMAPLKLAGGQEQPSLLRGVTEKALLVHNRVRLLEGSFPRPGEVMVGRLLHRRFGVPSHDLAPGKRLSFGRTAFTISGVFEASGTVLESEAWFDRNDLSTLTQRDTLSAIYLRLDDAEFDDVHVFTLQRNDLELSAIREDLYYEKLSVFYAPIRAMIWITTALVGAGAIFGGLNTLYAAFASRIREMATLQCIGYTRRALLLSFIQESLLATLSGSLIAFTLALVLLDGRNIPFSLGTFTIELTPAIILAGLATGVSLGTLGTLPPALRCLKPSLPVALRSS
ncbi:MAG: ABC transporter permease [Verrucomicrobiota bacterium]|nr:ABC transporter permease [Verrucomicrobiota bacterium]